MTLITDKKLRDKIMKEKTLELKKITELINQNAYEKKNKKNTGSLDINKREANNKGRTDPENGKIRRKTEKQKFRKPNMQIL